MDTLLNIALAVAANELLHNTVEIKSIREKVTRLDAYMHGKKFKELPINIDTRAKSYVISVVMFFVIVLPLWGLFTWINLQPETAIKTVIGLLVASYIITAITADKYHVEIEKLTRPYMKKKR